MLENTPLKALKQDLLDLKGFLQHKSDGLTDTVVKKQARAIMLNIKDTLEELIKQ